MLRPLIRLESITDIGPSALGACVVSGSHGGLYPAALASAAGVAAVIFNDAGVGRENAGVAGVLALGAQGMAAAAADCMSCHIGSTSDMLGRGLIGTVNPVAGALGVAQGMSVAEATSLLCAALDPVDRLPIPPESRCEVHPRGWRESILLVDSASLIQPDDAGRIVITGSHGALIGGDPARALKAKARIAAFNDAGFGPDRIGASRLPALDARGVAAVTVSCHSARIGDGRSAFDTGEISAMNLPATKLGAQKGLGLAAWLASLLT